MPPSCRLLEQHLAVAGEGGQQRQSRPADGPGIAADGAGADLHGRKPLAIEPRHLLGRAGQDPLADLGREGAVDDRGLEIDDGDGGHDGLGQARRRLLDPLLEMNAEIVPGIGRLPDPRRILAGGDQLLLQHIDRGGTDELLALLPAIWRQTGMEPTSAGIAGAARIEIAVEHDAATDEGADEEIDEVAKAGALAEEELGAAGGGGVVAEADGPGADPGDLRLDIDGAPALHGAGRRPHFALPIPELEGKRDAEPGDALLLLGRQRPGQALQIVRDEGGERGGERIGIGLVQPVADMAEEIDQHEIAAPPSDLEAEGEGTFGMQGEGYGGLAHPAPLGIAAQKQPVLLQPADDARGGLDRKPGQPRDLHLGQIAVAADQGEDQAFVVEPDAVLIAAPGMIESAWRWAGRHGGAGGRHAAPDIERSALDRAQRAFLCHPPLLSVAICSQEPSPCSDRLPGLPAGWPSPARMRLPPDAVNKSIHWMNLLTARQGIFSMVRRRRCLGLTRSGGNSRSQWI